MAQSLRRKPALGNMVPPVDTVRPYVLEAQIGHLLRRAHQRHVAVFQRIMGADAPTPTQFAVLFKLHAEQELSQNQLGRLTAMDPATVKGVVARLEERGLVGRLPDPDDQRRVKLRLTEAGHAMMTGLIERATAVSAATLAPLSREESERLVALLGRIS